MINEAINIQKGQTFKKLRFGNVDFCRADKIISKNTRVCSVNFSTKVLILFSSTCR